MKLKKQLLRLRSVLCIPPMVFLTFLLCGILKANAQTPQQIAKKALAATVLLVMEDTNGELLGYGSGFFVQPNQIATNFHVTDGAAQGTVKRVGQETEYTIEGTTAMDESHDLAILQVSAAGIQPLPLGDSDVIEVGSRVYIASNPKGSLGGSFVAGNIISVRENRERFGGSGIGKEFEILVDRSSIQRGYPYFSHGGPVLNDRGEVIDIATHQDRVSSVISATLAQIS